jgi:hypothetical protein
LRDEGIKERESKRGERDEVAKQYGRKQGKTNYNVMDSRCLCEGDQEEEVVFERGAAL